MFTRVLVANRGEIAVRVIRALRELEVEAVAIYSTADKDAAHVRLADRAVCIGPPPPAESYLNIASVVAAANTTGCEAVHPGYGFLAERPAFVEACVDNDLVFIGPDARVMAQMGDKVEAKAAMRAAGAPLVPGTEEATTLDQARKLAPGLGFPVLLKAAAGGGGRGMRLVTAADELEDAYATASGEAQAAFGDGSLYLEKAVVPARHVEIQVLADGKGGVLTLGERECSIQRRHQKLIEESPSAALTPELREEMESSAERACLATGYTNAGTLEFLLGPDGEFYFIELNARLQVEHPVSELVTGIDIVHEQLRIATGERVLALTGPDRAPPHPGRSRRQAGHARRGRRDDSPELRLADREALRLGLRQAGGDCARPPGAGRARGGGNRDDPRLRDRGAAQRRVRQRRLQHVVHRRAWLFRVRPGAARRSSSSISGT